MSGFSPSSLFHSAILPRRERETAASFSLADPKNWIEDLFAEQTTIANKRDQGHTFNWKLLQSNRDSLITPALTLEYPLPFSKNPATPRRMASSLAKTIARRANLTARQGSRSSLKWQLSNKMLYFSKPSDTNITYFPPGKHTL